MTLVIQMQTFPRYYRSPLSLLTKWHIMTQGPTDGPEDLSLNLSPLLPSHEKPDPNIRAFYLKPGNWTIIPKLIPNLARRTVEKSTKSAKKKKKKTLRLCAMFICKRQVLLIN